MRSFTKLRLQLKHSILQADSLERSYWRAAPQKQKPFLSQSMALKPAIARRAVLKDWNPRRAVYKTYKGRYNTLNLRHHFFLKSSPT